jgi:sialate O-acetylesterase
MFFGFVQISGFCCAEYKTCVRDYGGVDGGQTGADWAGLREAQMSAASMPMVGWATNADRAQGCDVHPPAKQDCAKRLARSALNLHYNLSNIAWRSPTFKSQSAVATLNGTVRISLNTVSSSGLKLVFPFNYMHTRGKGGTGPVVPTFDCNAHDQASPGTCAWASVQLSTGKWVNATISIANGSNNGGDGDGGGEQDHLVFTPDVPVHELSAGAALGSAYAWGGVPMMSVYDAGTDLPLLGWNKSL